jgi:hypothetical protein
MQPWPGRLDLTALGTGAILLLLALAEPQAFAVEDTDDSGSGAKRAKLSQRPKI